MPTDTLHIVKVSGKVIEQPELLKTFVKNFAALSGRKLLLYSGANLGQTVGAKLGVKNAKSYLGRPIVDQRVLDVMTMTYAGMVNTTLTALLQGRKIAAAGVTGLDMNLVTSVKQDLNGHDMGFTGAVKQVNTAAFARLLDGGTTPVLAPLSGDGNGGILFNETDAMAAEIAKALALRYDVTLIYCFERRGVLLNPGDNDSVVATLKRTQYKALREMNIISDWFVNKLENAYSAIDHGVKEVVITNAAQLASPAEGTHIRPSAARQS